MTAVALAPREAPIPEALEQEILARIDRGVQICEAELRYKLRWDEQGDGPLLELLDELERRGLVARALHFRLSEHGRAGSQPTMSRPCAAAAGSDGRFSPESARQRTAAATSRSCLDRSHERYGSKEASDRGVLPRRSACHRLGRLHVRPTWTAGRGSALLGRSGDPVALISSVARSTASATTCSQTRRFVHTSVITRVTRGGRDRTASGYADPIGAK